jgi:integrase/recombinase XerD
MSPRPKRERQSLKVADWPEADRLAWERAKQPSSPFAPQTGSATRWRPSTQQLHENNYGYFLGWMKRSGDLASDSQPAGRATREVVRAYLDHLEGTVAPMTRGGRLQSLGAILSAIAPDFDWSWINRAGCRIQAEANSVRDIDARLRSAEETLTLGLDMMHAAEHDRFRTDHDRGKLHRDGLIIALLSYRPIRLANLTAIKIGEHLQRHGGGWRLAFAEGDVKSKRAFEVPWPTELVEHLERHIDHFRSGLLGEVDEPEGPKALWVSRRGAMGEDALATQINDRTRTEFGIAINPHSFRHIAATTMATDGPADVTDAARVLGHVSPRTTEKYYNRATMVEAGKAYQTTIKARRRSGG